MDRKVYAAVRTAHKKKSRNTNYREEKTIIPSINDRWAAGLIM